MGPRRTRLGSVAVWVPVGYAVLVAAWIALSDRALSGLVHDTAQFERWGILKGWAFVIVSALALHVALRAAIRRRDEMLERLETSEARARTLVDHSPDGILIRVDDRVAFANEGAARLFGASRAEELVGRSVYDLLDPSEHADVRSRSQAMSAAPPLTVWPRLLRRLDGTPLRADVAAAPVRFDGQPALQITLRDVSEAWRLQDELRRTNQALRLLSQSVEAVERASDEPALLREVCRIAVEVAGYRLAWVGWAGKDEARTVRPAAWFGHDAGLVPLIELSWADAPRGRGAVGVAIRTGRPCAQVAGVDAGGDPGMLQEALDRGFVAGAAFPLFLGQPSPAGVLALMSGDPAAFDGPVLQLLQRLAEDLDFGLVALRTRAALEAERAGLAESRAQLRALAGRLDEVREEEKARIARDLHDELGQLLTGLKMELRMIERRLGELPAGPAVNALLDRAVGAAELADQTVASVQRIAAELRPGALDRLGLVPALRQEARLFQARTGIACETSLDEAMPEPPAEVATTLYRICQEAMTNVSRHAGATRVTVRLAAEDGAVVLQVEDDGRGLDEAEVGPGALGLLGMEERATRLGGEVRFSRGRPRGTVVTARVPFAPAVRSPA